MENEGIMSLPEGQAMQNQGPTNQPVFVSSADTYDAALTALGASTNDPAQVEAVKRAVREGIDELDLSPEEVSSLLEVLEYMSQNPDEYPQIRQRLIDSGMMDPDDLPEAYDPAYLGMAIMALNEYQATGVQGAQAPMEMAPVVEGLEPLAMAQGGLADMAKYLASQGRNGDTMLAHITPREARLLKAMGGSGTINPQTGLPEFFLKKLFKSVKKAVKKILKNPIVRIVATVALATVLGPAAAAAAGKVGIAMSTAATTAAGATLSSAAVSAMAGEKLNAKSLLINAATSYFGAGGTIGGVNPVGKVAELAGRIPGVTPGGAVAQGIGAGVTSAGIGALAGMRGQEALGLGLQSGIMTGIQTARANAAAAKAAQSPEMRGNMSQFSSQGQQAPPPPVTGEVAYGGEQGAMFSPEGGAAYRTPAAGPVTQTATATPTAAATGTPTAAATGSPTTAASPATTFTGRVGDFFKSPSMESFTDAFLVNPNATKGTLARYAPGVGTALAVAGLTGGFKAGEAEENPLFNRDYTGEDYIRDNPELFKNRVQPTKLEPYNPVVETPSYGLGTPGAGPTGQGPRATGVSTMPVSPIPTYLPPANTVTNMPGGIPQPYNVSGLYGVPLLYGNPVQPAARPPGYAQGGIVDRTIRSVTSNPQNVAQTEAMLFAGPQAAQQTTAAIQYLSNKPRGFAEGGDVGESYSSRPKYVEERPVVAEKLLPGDAGRMVSYGDVDKEGSMVYQPAPAGFSGLTREAAPAAASDYNSRVYTEARNILNMNPGMTWNQARDFIENSGRYNDVLGPRPTSPSSTGPDVNWGGNLAYDMSPIAQQFQWRDYIAANPDLQKAGIDTELEAALHYSNYGKTENRPGVSFLQPADRAAAMEEGIMSRRVPEQSPTMAPSTVSSPAPQQPRATGSVAPATAGPASLSLSGYTPQSIAMSQPATPPPTLTTTGSIGSGSVVQPYNVAGLYMPQGLRNGGQPTHFPRKTGPINGPGTGTSDSIPAMLSDGEFVFTAKAVRNAGQGSRRKGARRMYKLMKMLEGGNVKGK